MDFYTKMYPKAYFNNIKDVSIEFLQSHNIKGLLIDVDNTLIDYNKNILFGVKEWIDNMDKEGIKLCILSNTNNKSKVENVARDVLGANRTGMYSILVKPINEKDILITRIKRPFEKKIMDKYLNKK